MSDTDNGMLSGFYHYLGKIKTLGHAVIVSGIFASVFSLISFFGTHVALNQFGSPFLPVVRILGYVLPFSFVFVSSLLLIRGFAVLDQRNRHLVDLAERDGLTRLANRVGFLRRGEEMIRYAEKYNASLSLILFDVDRFKSINDSMGHLAGDMALQHLAQLMRETCREFDLAARWGGEEFAIMLQSANVHGSTIFAERLRKKIAESPFYWEDKPFNLTISAGVAEWSFHDASFKNVIERADKALYEAKANGRNRVEVSASPVAIVEGYEQDVQFDEGEETSLSETQAVA